MKLIIEDDEGHRTVVPFVRDEITIGRQEGNTIRLTERNVSRRHARLVRENGHVLVEDVGSAYGIHVNGERIREAVAVKDGDLIQIGDYDLAIQQDGASESTAIRPRPTAPDGHEEDESFGAEAEDTDTSEHAHEEEPDPGEVATAPGPVTPDPSRHPTAVIRAEAPAARAKRAPEAIAPEAAPRLVVLNTPLAGREFACISTVLRIGRTDENDITIDHPSLSRGHAQLSCDDAGRWTLSDLESANGLQVNGEKYAEVTLKHGDELELGHVRLKFVGAGQPFRFVPEREAKRDSSGGGGKWLVFALLVLGGGGYAGWRFRDRLPPPLGPTHTVVEAVPAPAPVAAAPKSEPAPPPSAATPTAVELLAQAKQANDAKEFGHSIELLDRIQGPSVDEAAQAKVLRETAEKELAARQALDAAKDALDSGDVAAAQKQLAGAEGTQAFAHELVELQRRIKASPKPKTTVAVKSVHPAPAPAGNANALYDQGKALLRGSQFREAATTFGQCLEVDPQMARCHMLLGASLAQLAASNPDLKGRSGQLEQAAFHYKKFLDLAGPEDAREVEKVKQILKSYDASRHP
jgi:pSer/pThr/pTyr-binding forkhead associated (FHA) protein